MSLAEAKCHDDSPERSPSEALSMAAKIGCSLPLPTRIAFVGNYLPRQCGIATFTTDLCSALEPNTAAIGSLRFR
jgi:hypothetical protein